MGMDGDQSRITQAFFDAFNCGCESETPQMNSDTSQLLFTLNVGASFEHQRVQEASLGFIPLNASTLGAEQGQTSEISSPTWLVSASMSS